MATRLRLLSCVSRVLSALLIFPFSSAAFDTPLSDTAVREAYFLGQRHDETFARFLDKYTKHLSAPASGPFIESVTFLTPFASMVEYSSRQSNYSAQQAQLDHRDMTETVIIRVEIWLTSSYGPFLMKPTNSRSGTPTGVQLRSSSFWRQMRFQVFDGDKEMVTDTINGEPQYRCSDDACILSGASVWIEYPATAFTSETATLRIDPPEGEPVTVDFDLSSIR